MPGYSSGFDDSAPTKPYPVKHNVARRTKPAYAIDDDIEDQLAHWLTYGFPGSAVSLPA